MRKRLTGSSLLAVLSPQSLLVELRVSQGLCGRRSPTVTSVPQCPPGHSLKGDSSEIGNEQKS